MFEIKLSDLTVYETSSDFRIVLNATGESAVLGDGVDLYQDNNGNSIPVGSPEFYRLLAEDLTHNQAEWVEAYFPWSFEDQCYEYGPDPMGAGFDAAPGL